MQEQLGKLVESDKSYLSYKPYILHKPQVCGSAIGETGTVLCFPRELQSSVGDYNLVEFFKPNWPASRIRDLGDSYRRDHRSEGSM